MSGHGEKRPRQTEKAIAALLACGSIVDAATQSGLAEHTLRRWLRDPDFQAAYRDARRQVVQQAVAQLQAACGEAVDGLRAVLADSDAPASARVAAARAVLELSLRAIEQEDFGERIARLEAREGTV